MKKKELCEGDVTKNGKVKQKEGNESALDRGEKSGWVGALEAAMGG